MSDGASGEPVAPTRDDPLVGALSEGVGGPLGLHAGRHPWWTPLRVILAFTALAFAVGLLQKAPCYQDTWSDGEQRYAAMCYSDLPYLYTGRGFVELHWPYTDDEQVRGRYEVMEYPVGISYFAWGTAWVTHFLTSAPDVSVRAQRPTSSFWGDPVVVREIRVFVVVSALLFAALALLSARLLAGVNPGRPWDAMAFAVSPALVLSGLVNWDLLSVALVAGALWAWARDRPVLTGVLIGLGTATKLYPLFLLGGLLIVCVRSRRYADLARACVAAALAWLLANAPALVTSHSAWKVFWSFNEDRGADLGSVWLMMEQLGKVDFAASTINTWSWFFFGLWCLGVLAIGLLAPESPRLAQLGFLVVTGFLLVNKVYSPQYVLWLLPLAVLARPRWRDLLIWQAGEVLYFGLVWLYLGGWLDASTGSGPAAYWFAILLRMLAQLWLVSVVVRDVLKPWRDPVDRYAVEADPVSPAVALAKT